MQFKITWSRTQDYILFDSLNDDLVEWFIVTNHKQNSKYQLADQVIDILMRSADTNTIIQEEQAYMHKVNEALKKLRLPIIREPTDWFDQQQLNRLHADWSETRFNMPKLSELFYHMDPDLYRAYQEMNCHIHLIERSFDYSFRAIQYWSLPNPFQHKWFEWQNSHLRMTYPGHGRQAFEQFEWMDDNEDMLRGMNNWGNLDSFVDITLRRPYRMQPPEEFVAWCQQHDILPNHYHIPLANVHDWRNRLTEARHTLAKNVKLEENYFSLDIV